MKRVSLPTSRTFPLQDFLAGKIFQQALILAILLLGFGLRLFQLGHDSLWNDEAGVALVALESDLIKATFALRWHAMAMPLDYFVAWAVIRLSRQEFFLRLPALFWGTLSLAIAYRLFRRLADKKVAILAVLLMSLAALLVQYSQELRFYAPLVFFYLFSTDQLLKAIRQPSWANWLGYVVITSLGIYFHIYVILTVFTGAVWLLLTERPAQPEPGRRRPITEFLVSAGLVSVAFAVGYLLFGATQSFDRPLLQLQPSLLQGIIQGLGGWPLNYQPTPGAAYLWGILGGGLSLVGLFSSLRQPRSWVSGLIWSSALQIALIILMDWIKHYWFLYRQLLELLPYTYFFAALGVFVLGAKITKVLGHLRPQKYMGPAINAILISSLVVSSFPLLAAYYAWPKSRARNFSLYLTNHWSTGDKIFVIPSYEEKIYRYYLGDTLARPDIVPAIRPVEIETLPLEAARGYLIVGRALSSQEQTTLARLGFERVTDPSLEAWDQQQLYHRTSAP